MYVHNIEHLNANVNKITQLSKNNLMFVVIVSWSWSYVLYHCLQLQLLF